MRVKPSFFASLTRFSGYVMLRTSPVNRCTFISNLVYVEGRCRTGEGMVENVYRLQPGETFIRCEIEDDRGRRAWLSPVRL